MTGRVLEQHEILPALRIVWDVYVSDVAPLQTPEAVALFQSFIKYDNILPHVEKKELTFFGVFDEEKLIGVSALGRTGEIKLLYVKKEYQKKGNGKRLVLMMGAYCANVLIVTRMWIKAYPVAVVPLQHIGLVDITSVQNVGAEIFVPMEIRISPASIEPEKSKSKTAIYVAVVIVVGLLLLGVLARMVYTEARKTIVESSKNTELEPFYNDDDSIITGDIINDLFGEQGNTTESKSGLDQIPEYKEENLPYEIVDELFQDIPNDKKTTYVNFEVHYPQIDGLEESVQSKVNDVLKESALKTYVNIYENPDMTIKERVLGEKQPILADFVQYKVCYATKDYLCVAYEDYSYEGNKEYYYVGLRTVNIDLKSGNCYELKDLIDINDSFVSKWLDIMRNEADSKELLEELSEDKLKNILNGSTKNEVYQPTWFMDRDGMEIGLSFHYDKNDENDSGYGWVTAPFSAKQLEKYKTDLFHDLTLVLYNMTTK